LDEAVLRRLPEKHYIGLPDQLARSRILTNRLSKVPNNIPPHIIGLLSLETNGMSGSELSSMVELATNKSVTRRRREKAPAGSEKVIEADLRNALLETGRAVTVDDLQKYKEWAKDHGLRTDRIQKDIDALYANKRTGGGEMSLRNRALAMQETTRHNIAISSSVGTNDLFLFFTGRVRPQKQFVKLQDAIELELPLSPDHFQVLVIHGENDLTAHIEGILEHPDIAYITQVTVMDNFLRRAYCTRTFHFLLDVLRARRIRQTYLKLLSYTAGAAACRCYLAGARAAKWQAFQIDPPNDLEEDELWYTNEEDLDLPNHDPASRAPIRCALSDPNKRFSHTLRLPNMILAFFPMN